jgi:hypothetical protein
MLPLVAFALIVLPRILESVAAVRSPLQHGLAVVSDKSAAQDAGGMRYMVELGSPTAEGARPLGDIEVESAVWHNLAIGDPLKVGFRPLPDGTGVAVFNIEPYGAPPAETE